MSPICQRAFRRDDQKASIKIADYDSKERFFDAVMYNSSEGGMYFEAKDALQPGSDIWIKVSDYSPEIHGKEAMNGYRAEVMWCRKIYKKDEKNTSYGVGVRFMVNTCSQCGEKVAYSDIQRMENFLFLCSSCVRQLESLPNGKIKDCFNNFLIGNVV